MADIRNNQKEMSERMQHIIEKGKIIGEYNLEDYHLPTTKGYLFHQISKQNNNSENR